MVNQIYAYMAELNLQCGVIADWENEQEIDFKDGW